MFESQPIFAPLPTHPSCHCATIVETPCGDLLAAWYAGAYETAPDQAIFCARRSLGATSWTPPEVLLDTPGHADGQPLLFVDPRGRLWFLWVTIEGPGRWNDASIMGRFSTDDGHTWSEMRYLRREWGWMIRNKPIILDTGEILLPLYDERQWHTVMGISADAGESWEFGGEIITHPGNIQATVIQRADGTLLALMRTGGTRGHLWQATSTDRGRSWSRAVRGPFPNPNSGIDMVRLANGHLVLAFNNTPQGRTPLNVALSTDEGRTWPVVRALETSLGEYSYPAIIQARDGMIHLVYTWRRETIRHVAFDEAWLQG